MPRITHFVSAGSNRLTLLLLALAGLSGCASDRIMRANNAQPVFDAVAFFEGRTVGRGMLKVMFRRGAPTLVNGTGTVLPDHSIVLDQTVRRAERAPTHRQWRLRPDGANGYVGTLSDAAGPVTGAVQGNRLHLSFAMKGGLQAEQWLYLDPSGRVAHNVMTVRKLGITVARLDETITREPR